jgi:hypothetical protein
MDRLLSLRRQVYDHSHASTIREDLFLLPGNRDRFAQYETAMLLIQDTGEALWTHRECDFSPSAMAAYIEVWGVMQAVVIQQDALLELAAALEAPKPVPGAAWRAIRDLRNQLVGHPSNKRSLTKTPLRAFMGREPKSYRHLTYELWDAGADRTTFPRVDLGQLLDAYESEAADHLATSLAHMRQAWPLRVVS